MYWNDDKSCVFTTLIILPEPPSLTMVTTVSPCVALVSSESPIIVREKVSFFSRRVSLLMVTMNDT